MWLAIMSQWLPGDGSVYVTSTYCVSLIRLQKLVLVQPRLACWIYCYTAKGLDLLSLIPLGEFCVDYSKSVCENDAHNPDLLRVYVMKYYVASIKLLQYTFEKNSPAGRVRVGSLTNWLQSHRCVSPWLGK